MWRWAIGDVLANLIVATGIVALLGAAVVPSLRYAAAAGIFAAVIATALAAGKAPWR